MHFRIRPAAAVAVALAFILSAPAGAAGSQFLSVRLDSKAEYQRLLDQVPEASTCGSTVAGDALEFAAAPGRLAELRALGFEVEAAIDDLEGFFASRLSREGPFGAYHTYDEAIVAMDGLAAAYPEIMTPKASIGQSVEGRELWVYKISDHPAVDEDEPEIFFNAYIHAREVITFEVLRDLAQHLLESYGSDPRATAIVDGREIWIQPVVNPDGVQYNYQTHPQGGGMWRKNRRNNGGGTYGVDLNRNFGHQWGYDDEGSSPYGSSETYRGTGPFSEPETAAIRDFCNAREFTVALNYHSYGNYNLHSWGYDQFHCEDHEGLFRLGRIRSDENGYAPGAAWEMLYRVNGDANDWMYGEQQSKPKIFAYVTEVGSSNDSFWPPESRIPALVAENREGNLRAIELADNPQRVLPPGLARVETEGATPPTFTLTWSVPDPDPDNPAIAWNLIEATGPSLETDDLEADPATRWTSVGWSWVTNRSHSPTHSFFGGNDNRLNNVLESRRGHLVEPGESLRFWTYYRIESNWDYGYVEIATDGRAFTTLPGSITTNSDPNDRNFGNGITGNSGGWVEAEFDLSAYEGEVVWFRFRYNTDGYVTDEGWYVDDIEPAEFFETETLVAEGHPVAEYTFTDHAPGEFAYLVQSVDVEGDHAAYGPSRLIEVGGYADVGEEESHPEAWSGIELVGAQPISGPAAFRFTVPPGAREGEPVRFTIHDVNGRQVADLRPDLPRGGDTPGTTLEATWNGAGAAAGIYFARLTVGDRSAFRRFVLMP